MHIHDGYVGEKYKWYVLFWINPVFLPSQSPHEVITEELFPSNDGIFFISDSIELCDVKINLNLILAN